MFNIYAFLLKLRFLHILFWSIKIVSLYHDLSVSWKNIPTNYIIFCVLLEIGFQIICVYTTIFYLIPKYFYTKKFIKYNLLALSIYFFSSVLVESISDIYSNYFFSKESTDYNWIIVIGNFLNIITLCIIFSILYLVDYYYTKDKNHKEKEKERLLSELDFLKAQLNPHFLFNAINNIYVLIDEDKKVSKDFLVKFSDLLRYQLYECSKQNNYLYQEINFIKNYIEFEKIRLNKNVIVETNLSEVDKELLIAPLLLIPFVENAFKHVSTFDRKENIIIINSTLINSTFYLTIVNTFDINDIKNNSSQGLGLANVKRRLELLYTDQYYLKIHTENYLHTVKLQITLKD